MKSMAILYTTKKSYTPCKLNASGTSPLTMGLLPWEERDTEKWMDTAHCVLCPTTII